MLKKLFMLFLCLEASSVLCCNNFKERDILRLVNYEYIYDYLVEGEKALLKQEDGVDGKNLLVALGLTGTGVSLFSSVMFGYEPKKNSMDLAIHDSSLEPPFNFQNGFESVTIYPSIKKIPDTKKFICDTPGVLDSRGKVRPISNEIIRNIIVKKFDYINGLIVNVDVTCMCEDSSSMFYLLGSIGKLLPLKNIEESVLFVANVKKYYSYPSDIQGIIESSLRRAKWSLAQLKDNLESCREGYLYCKEKKSLAIQIDLIKNAELVLNILKKREAKGELVEFDPFDGGESRRKVLDLVANLKPISTSSIDFVAASPECNLFVSNSIPFLITKIRDMKSYLQTSIEAPNLKKFEPQKMIKLLEYFKFDSDKNPNLTSDLIRLSKEIEGHKATKQENKEQPDS